MGGIKYAATSDRFVEYEEMITGTEVNSIPIDRVRDAEYDEDLTDKLFGTGDVRIESAHGDSIYFNDALKGDALLQAVRGEIAAAETIDVENPQVAGTDR